MEKKLNKNDTKLVTELKDTRRSLIRRYNETKSPEDARDVDVLNWILEKAEN